MKTELLWEIIIVMIVVGTVISVVIAIPNKEPPQNKCIDGTLYQLTDQDYALAYTQKCKALPVEETRE